MGPSPISVTKAVQDRIAHVDATADYGYDHKALYDAIGRLINADSSDIALTHNVSEGISIIASGIPPARGRLGSAAAPARLHGCQARRP